SIVMVDSIPTPGNKVISELITAVPHCNGTDFWVIAHDSFFGGNNFWVYRVSASGITNAAGDSPLPDVYSGFNLYASKGTLKVSRDGSLIVMSGFQDGGPAVPSIALYNFDRTTGAIDEERIIFRGRFFTASAAFSATANYVYAVTYNWPDSINEVFKIDLDGNAELLHRTTDVMWGVTLGPDDRIYTSGELRSHLGMVPNPDDQVSLYHHNGVDLTDGYPAAASLLSLPNFIDAYPVSKVDHDFRTFNPSCNTYEFQPTNPCLATSYDWDFGDMNTSTSAMPVHTYTAPGTYDVTLVIDGTDTIVHTIQHGIAGDLFGSDSICLGNEGGLFANNYSTQGCATCSYTWTVAGGSITGPTTQDNVDIQWSTNPASVSVMVTDEATGCQFTESMNVQLSDCVQSASSLSGGWSWNIHPNPSSGAVFVELSGLSTALTIEVISTDGKVVLSHAGFRGNLFRINSGALSKGVYSIRIRNEQLFSTKRLVVY
ncbi:MAG: PKD domain-containing protein, partial [Bacteroidota bacterium]